MADINKYFRFILGIQCQVRNLRDKHGVNVEPMEVMISIGLGYTYMFLHATHSFKGAANGFYPLVLGKKVNIDGYGYILVCKCV